MTKTTFRPNRAVLSLRAVVCIPFLCLIATLAAGCSVDIGKLRLRSPTSDGSIEHPDVSDATGTGSGDTDDSRGSVDVDSASVLPDLPIADEVAVWKDAKDLPELDVAEDIVASFDVTDSLDLATADEDTDGAGMDGGGGTGGVGGTGGGGTGGVNIDGGGGTGGVDMDGGGGTGGTGGRGGGGTGGVNIDGGGGTGGTGGRGGTGGKVGTGGTGGADPDLVLWYKFDESSGMIAADSSTSSSGTHDGTLAYGMGGSAIFSPNSQVGTYALSLTPSASSPSTAGGYVTVPALNTLAPDAITVAVWVKLAAATPTQNWERIFDFATGTFSTGPYFYMTARDGGATNTPVRFGISRSGRTGTSMQPLEGTSALTANVWYHIAVVLPAGSLYTGTLYINGQVVATNNTMTLHLSDLATTTTNWLGRSQFSGADGSDPYFYGSLDDFRVYKRALSQQEISSLFALR
jgi:hypothetical protein